MDEQALVGCMRPPDFLQRCQQILSRAETQAEQRPVTTMQMCSDFAMHIISLAQHGRRVIVKATSHFKSYQMFKSCLPMNKLAILGSHSRAALLFSLRTAGHLVVVDVTAKGRDFSYSVNDAMDIQKMYTASSSNERK